MKLQTLSEAITRRDFMRASSALAASTLAGGLASAAQAADAPASPSAQSAYPHPLLTPAEKFRDVSRGEPRPDTLKGDALVQARLTPETWRLEITADATPNPAIKESAGLSKPLTLTDGFYGDINPGISLAAPDPSGWVEFGGAGEVKFTFAENVSITKITLSMARWEPAAVYLPDVLKVNSVDYSGYAGTFNDQDRAFINLEGNWAGTDLTIYFSHSQYLFMDEVSFDGTPVPEPSTTVLLSGALILLGISYRSRASKK